MSILKDFTHHGPTSLKEALSLLAKTQDACLLAGGTLLLNTLKKSTKYPVDVVSLKKIPELKGIQDFGGQIKIGAMTTIVEVVDSALVHQHAGSLHQAVSLLATTPLRNMATIAGNICSRFYWVDLPAVLISLQAQLILALKRGDKKISVEEYLRQEPKEPYILTHVMVPKKDVVTFYARHTKTMEVDIPSLALSFCAERQGAKLSCVKAIVNTTLSLPLELKNVQALLEGREAGRVDVSDVFKALDKDTASSKLDDYRKHLLGIDLANILADLK